MHRKILVLLTGLVLALTLFVPVKAEAASPVYTISPSSPTYKKNMMNFTTYNKYTKHYYLLRTYLEQLEKSGGGTLVLKKGTYSITNTLYVPSNVTIKLLDGATIVKATATGTPKFKAASSIFQLIRPSRAYKTSVYGGYKGEKNISFIGEGKAVIDLKYMTDSIAIIAGHNRNIKVEGIRFQNMKSGHFIEMDATSGAVIRNNQFTGSKPSIKSNKEAINLDTPDKQTQGWSQQWSKFDKTANANILIENNLFYNLDRSVGTHKFSGGQFHDRVTMRGNTIQKMRQDAIRVMNWSNAVIEDNLIKDVDPGPDDGKRGILASGAINPTFRNNIIENVPRPIQFMPWKNSGPGSIYPVTFNSLNAANLAALETNTAIHYKEDFIRINKKYNQFEKNTTDFVYVQTR